MTFWRRNYGDEMKDQWFPGVRGEKRMTRQRN